MYVLEKYETCTSGSSLFFSPRLIKRNTREYAVDRPLDRGDNGLRCDNKRQLCTNAKHYELPLERHQPWLIVLTDRHELDRQRFLSVFRRLTLGTQRKHSLRDFNRCEIALSPNAKLSLQMYQSSVQKRNDCATPVRRLGSHCGCV